ncbi:hypothetical protein NDI42_04995 [Funiculus sociatus GB2-C1]
MLVGLAIDAGAKVVGWGVVVKLGSIVKSCDLFVFFLALFFFREELLFVPLSLEEACCTKSGREFRWEINVKLTKEEIPATTDRLRTLKSKYLLLSASFDIARKFIGVPLL